MFELRKALVLRFLLTVTLLVVGLGCSGYAFKKQNNPLAHYGVNSVAVPLFYNKSQLPRASSIMTSKFIEMLTRFKDLEVYTGENANADAYLIGIVRSEDEKNKTYMNEGVQLASAVASDNIGNRLDFLVPSSTGVEASLELYLVRNATPSQINYLLQKGPDMFSDVEIIFTKEIPISFSFKRQLLNGESQAVNQTQTMGNYEQSLISVSNSVAESFRTEMLLTF